jgi:hypothetical protein
MGSFRRPSYLHFIGEGLLRPSGREGQRCPHNDVLTGTLKMKKLTAKGQELKAKPAKTNATSSMPLL